MGPLDNQVGTVHRWKEPAVTQRPMVAASHPGAGDPHDGAKDEVRERNEERRVSESAQGRKSSHHALMCILRHVTTSDH